LPLGRAFAQAAAPSPAASGVSADARARALRHFEEGRAHYRARRFAQAARAFRAALALVPSAALWFNLGRAHEELGEHRMAADCFRRYLRDGGLNADDSDAVRERIARLEALDEAARADRRARPIEGVLLLDAPDAEVSVRIDGEPVGDDGRAQPWWLPAGTHRLEVQRGDREPFRADVEIHAGGLTLARLPEEEVGASTQVRADTQSDVWVWSLAGISAAALVAGGASAYVAVDRRRAGEFGAADDWGTVSDGAVVTAAVAAVAACIAALVDAP
jgi:tetratricopeptide (TPR) repeat protein